MKSFLSGSLLLFLIFSLGCKRQIAESKVSGKEVVITSADFTRSIPTDSTVIYKTGVNAYGQYISGLLIIKPGQGEDYRILFTTEMGVKLFDFEFVGNQFKVHSCIEKLNKKPVIKLLKNDFSLLLSRGVAGRSGIISPDGRIIETREGKETRLYKLAKEEKLIDTIQTFSRRGKEKVVLSFQRKQDIVPSHIFLEHRNLNLNMKLDLIRR